jgi:hypothetical protein
VVQAERTGMADLGSTPAGDRVGLVSGGTEEAWMWRDETGRDVEGQIGQGDGASERSRAMRESAMLKIPNRSYPPKYRV